MTALVPVPVIPKRKRLTKAQRARVFDQANGICHLCKEPIKLGERWEAEHPEFRAGGGSDRIEDMRPAHYDCHKPKTADDIRTLAKTNRVRTKHLGIRQRGPLAGADATERAARKAARHQDRRGDRPDLPPRRPMYV